MAGYIVTWDVDSRNMAQCARVRRFVFGYSKLSNGKRYQYPGLVEQDGVRYLGQSVVFVTPIRLQSFRDFLRLNGVDHVVTHASLGESWPGMLRTNDPSLRFRTN